MDPRLLPTAAAASYAANCLLGAGVATGVISTKRVRWLHHALFVTTASLTAASAAAAIVGRKAGPATLLLGALGVLGAAPFVDTRSWRHGAVASAAAPFFVAALTRSWRDHGVS